jgi:hypothetical protein
MGTRWLVLISFLSGCDCGGSTPIDDGGTDAGGTARDASSTSDGGRDAGPADAGARDAGTDASVEPMCSAARPCRWRRATPASSPPALAWAAMAYDRARERIVLFGGAATVDGGSISGATWSWDGATWTELALAAQPSPRWTHGMVYDDARERVVLFGGQSDSAGNALDDTWEWDGSAWTEIATASAPSPRGVHGGMAYDTARERVVLRGGGTLPGRELFADTWEYDGAGWVEVEGPGPSPRVGPAMVYDPARGRTLLFGGGTWSPYFDDLWQYDGAGWTEIALDLAPPERQSGRMVFDPTRDLVVLFGGGNIGTLSDLWEWDGTEWTEIALATAPSPRCCYSYAHDTSRHETVLFGPDDETWIYGP